MRFNKGEWSELYALFYLMVTRELKLIDFEGNRIDESIFYINQLVNETKKGNLVFEFENDRTVTPVIFGKRQPAIALTAIACFKEQLFDAIHTNGGNGGAFQLSIIEKWFQQNNIPLFLKSPAFSKHDIMLKSFDRYKQSETALLGYSVKSQLGSPATILNASQQTKINIESVIYQKNS